MQSIPGDKHIISTKLYRPLVSKNHVHREDLLAKLNQGRQQPLILISAPAGYGKSTLVSCWLETCPAPSSWLSLDEDDNDFRLFLSYFVSAIHKIFPGTCSGALSMLKVAHMPSVSALAGRLINELELIEKEFYLVLDDYHVIRDRSIHQLVTNLLNNPSGLMHVILISRRDPPLPLTRLRARGQMTEIRTGDIRFSLGETKQLLQLAIGEPIDDTVAAMLEERTEGWVTGLCLAIMALRNRENLHRALIEMPVENRYVIDYIVNEILLHQPPAILEFMLKSAILNRFCAALCEVVCCPGKATDSEGSTGSTFLETLEKDNMFLIPLDDEGEWFRYHHLFQSLLKRQLRKRLKPEDISNLNKLASEWFREHGFIEEAITHALESGDKNGAVRLVKRYRYDIMNREQWFHMSRWLDKFSPGIIKEDPELLLAEAWRYQREARYPKLFDTLDEIDHCVSPPDDNTPADPHILYGEICLLRSFQYYATGQAKLAETNARQATTILPPQFSSGRGFAFLLLAAALQLQGKLGDAQQVIHGAMQQEEASTTPIYKTMLLVALCYTSWISTESKNLKLAAAQLIRNGKKYNLPETINVGCYFSGITAYQQNDLSSAERFLLPVVTSPMLGEFAIPSIVTYCQSSIALSATYLAMGRKEDASDIAESVSGRMLESGNSDLLELCQAFRAELALGMGNVTEADVWLKHYSQRPLTPDYRFYMAHLTPSRILIARRTAESLGEAAMILSQLYDYYAGIHNTRTLIDILVLQALLYGRQGDEEKSFNSLQQGLGLAEPGNFIRPFLNYGPEMADILGRLVKKKPGLHYARRIIKTFKSKKSVTSLRSRSSLSDDLPALPLSNREVEVLKILAKGMSNDEIADVLQISPETVKRHLSTIYGKLEAKNRQQAVLSGKAIGIL